LCPTPQENILNFDKNLEILLDFIQQVSPQRGEENLMFVIRSREK